MQSAALVNPDLQSHPYALAFSPHARCIPDQIRLLISGERTVRGREEFLNKGENDKIRTNPNFVRVVYMYCKGLSSPGRNS
jgi:hypothetical protein